MKGEVKSVEPYSLSLTNRYDDDATIQADVTVDTNKRSVVFKTNYDLGKSRCEILGVLVSSST